MPEHFPQRDCIGTDSTCSEDGHRLLNERLQLMGKKNGEQREGMSRGRKEGGKAVDATQSALSVMNKPRCLRDKADESEWMCRIFSSLLP